MVRTSITHPLRIDDLSLGNGRLGITFCPGKKGDSVFGAAWDRDLDLDMDAIKGCYECACRATRSAITSGPGHCSAACQIWTGGSWTGAKTSAGSEQRCKTRGYTPVSQAKQHKRLVKYRKLVINDAAASRSCLVGLRTDVVSQRDTTAARRSFYSHRSRRNRHLLTMSLDPKHAVNIREATA